MRDSNTQASFAMPPSAVYQVFFSFRATLRESGVLSSIGSDVWAQAIVMEKCGRGTLPWDAVLVDLDKRITGFQESAPLARDQAMEFLRLLPRDLPLPQALSSVDGEVIFVWHHRGDRVSIEFQTDGCLLWIGRFNGFYEPGDDVPWDGTLPVRAEEIPRHLYAKRVQTSPPCPAWISPSDETHFALRTALNNMLPEAEADRWARKIIAAM